MVASLLFFVDLFCCTRVLMEGNMEALDVNPQQHQGEGNKQMITEATSRRNPFNHWNESQFTLNSLLSSPKLPNNFTATKSTLQSHRGDRPVTVCWDFWSCIPECGMAGHLRGHHMFVPRAVSEVITGVYRMTIWLINKGIRPEFLSFISSRDRSPMILRGREFALTTLAQWWTISQLWAFMFAELF